MPHPILEEELDACRHLDAPQSGTNQYLSLPQSLITEFIYLTCSTIAMDITQAYAIATGAIFGLCLIVRVSTLVHFGPTSSTLQCVSCEAFPLTYEGETSDSHLAFQGTPTAQVYLLVSTERSR